MGNGTLEVHEHCYLGEERRSDIEHSHEGGARPHWHQHCGPAHYTIDKDEWLRATGLKGGGRKKFTAKPTGPQLPIVPIAPEENTFRVIFVDEYTDGHQSAGISPEDFALMRRDFVENMAAGAHAIERMKQSFGMTPIYEIVRPGDDDGRERDLPGGPGRSGR